MQTSYPSTRSLARAVLGMHHFLFFFAALGSVGGTFALIAVGSALGRGAPPEALTVGVFVPIGLFLGVLGEWLKALALTLSQIWQRQQEFHLRLLGAPASPEQVPSADFVARYDLDRAVTYLSKLGWLVCAVACCAAVAFVGAQRAEGVLLAAAAALWFPSLASLCARLSGSLQHWQRLHSRVVHADRRSEDALERPPAGLAPGGPGFSARVVSASIALTGLAGVLLAVYHFSQLPPLIPRGPLETLELAFYSGCAGLGPWLFFFALLVYRIDGCLGSLVAREATLYALVRGQQTPIPARPDVERLALAGRAFGLLGKAAAVGASLAGLALFLTVTFRIPTARRARSVEPVVLAALILVGGSVLAGTIVWNAAHFWLLLSDGLVVMTGVQDEIITHLDLRAGEAHTDAGGEPGDGQPPSAKNSSASW